MTRRLRLLGDLPATIVVPADSNLYQGALVDAVKVYLHGTPSPELFLQTRRDFSHGCIRVEKPAELTAWVLRDKPDWSLERVRAAMTSGRDNVQINLTNPVPVLILYGTAVIDPDGQVHLFDDIYGYDDELKEALAKGYPYPE